MRRMELGIGEPFSNNVSGEAVSVSLDDERAKGSELSRETFSLFFLFGRSVSASVLDDCDGEVALTAKLREVAEGQVGVGGHVRCWLELR